MSGQLGAIPYIIENVTKLGVSGRKIQAVNLFNTLNYYINYMVRFMWMLFLKFTCTNYKGNMATVSQQVLLTSFRAAAYAETFLICIVCSRTIWRVTPTPHQFAFVSPLG